MAELFLKVVNMSISAGWLVLAVVFLRMPVASGIKALPSVRWILERQG